MSKNLFAEFPEDVSGLSLDDLNASLAEINATLLKVKDRDEDTLGDLTIPEAYEQSKAAVAHREVLAARIAELSAADVSFDDEMAKLTEGIEAPVEAEAVEEPAVEIVAEATEETPAEEVVAEEVAEPVLASGTSLKAARPRPPAAKEQPVQPVEEEKKAYLLATSGVPGFASGDILDKTKLRDAMIEAYSSPSNQGRQKRVVARADYKHLFPDDRVMTQGMTASALMDIINNVVGEQALLASGGLCAPVTPYYNLMTVATAARPVRDSLPSFQAVRGGLQFGAPLHMSDIAAGVGIKTEAEDSAGGTFAEKDCVFVACPSFSTVTLNMIYRCLTFGNLNSRAFPEMVNQAIELAMAYHARVADSALLDYISAHSTKTTQAVQYGATSTLIDSILYATAGIRSRQRMSPDARFRLLLPAWSRELIATDVVNSQFQRFDIKPGDTDALLRSYGVDPAWYLDTETGEGQIFGTQSAGVLLDFPNTLDAYLFPEGSFLFLDGGTLDLGVVRDSVLNSTNDFEVFAETFEAAAYIGVESLRIKATICPNGTVAAPATAFTCS